MPAEAPENMHLGNSLERSLDALTSKSIFWWPRRRLAVQTLTCAELNADMRNLICDRLSRHVLDLVSVTDRNRTPRRVLLVIVITSFALVVIRHIDQFQPPITTEASLLTMGLLAVALAACKIPDWFDTAAAGTARSALIVLRAMADVSALPAVAAALRNRMTADAAAEALEKLAPLVASPDYGRFGPGLEADLCAALRNAEESTALIILQVLGHIGSSQSLGIVEHLAANGYSHRKRQLASEALPMIRERALRKSMAISLLRPATPAAGEYTLVRASVNESGIPTEQLLRPYADEASVDVKSGT